MNELLERFAHLSSWEISLGATLLLLQGGLITVFPEEVISTTMGVLWSRGQIGFVQALLSIQCGVLPANAFPMLMAHKFGDKILSWRIFRWAVKPQMLERAKVLVRKYGVWIVAAVRFTPSIRAPVYLALGTSKIRVRNFVIADYLASCVQVPMWLLVGNYIGSHSTSLVVVFQKMGIVFGGIILISLIIVFMTSRLNRNKVR